MERRRVGGSAGGGGLVARSLAFSVVLLGCILLKHYGGGGKLEGPTDRLQCGVSQDGRILDLSLIPQSAKSMNENKTKLRMQRHIAQSDPVVASTGSEQRTYDEENGRREREGTTDRDRRQKKKKARTRRGMERWKEGGTEGRKGLMKRAGRSKRIAV